MMKVVESFLYMEDSVSEITANILALAAYDLVTQGSRPTGAMVLNYFS